MKPHIRYIVEGQIIGSVLLKEGIENDKELKPIEPLSYYPYTIIQTDNERMMSISETAKFYKL